MSVCEKESVSKSKGETEGEGDKEVALIRYADRGHVSVRLMN